MHIPNSSPPNPHIAQIWRTSMMRSMFMWSNCSSWSKPSAWLFGTVEESPLTGDASSRLEYHDSNPVQVLPKSEWISITKQSPRSTNTKTHLMSWQAGWMQTEIVCQKIMVLKTATTSFADPNVETWKPSYQKRRSYITPIYGDVHKTAEVCTPRIMLALVSCVIV